MNGHDQTRPASAEAASVTFEEVENPPLELLQAVNRGLDAYNRTKIGDYTHMRLGVFVYAEGAEKTLIGGVWGDLLWDWLHIETLWVHPDYHGRGIGSELMRRAEESARAHGVQNIHLETTSFQALPFYRKLGFEVFGELPNKPRGQSWYYLKREGPPIAQA